MTFKEKFLLENPNINDSEIRTDSGFELGREEYFHNIIFKTNNIKNRLNTHLKGYTLCSIYYLANPGNGCNWKIGMILSYMKV